MIRTRQPRTALAPPAALSGSTGCNLFTGSWVQHGDTLDIGIGLTTLRACDVVTGSQEAAVLAGLEATASFTVSPNAPAQGSTLSLLDHTGAVRLTWVRS